MSDTPTKPDAEVARLRRYARFEWPDSAPDLQHTELRGITIKQYRALWRHFDRLTATLAERDKELQDIVASLPQSYYLDPPDGGSVSVAEQVRRMSIDAKGYGRAHAKICDAVLLRQTDNYAAWDLLRQWLVDEADAALRVKEK